MLQINSVATKEREIQIFFPVRGPQAAILEVCGNLLNIFVKKPLSI